jgi:hypothetical protein
MSTYFRSLPQMLGVNKKYRLLKSRLTIRRGDFIKAQAVKCDLDSSNVRSPLPLSWSSKFMISLRSSEDLHFKLKKWIRYISPNREHQTYNIHVIVAIKVGGPRIERIPTKSVHQFCLSKVKKLSHSLRMLARAFQLGSMSSDTRFPKT